jgi:hypothetical protein
VTTPPVNFSSEDMLLREICALSAPRMLEVGHSSAQAVWSGPSFIEVTRQSEGT